MNLDKWQRDVLDCKGNLCLRSGRQVGKSTVISIKGGQFAMEHANKIILIIASVERQAQLLFEKVLSYIYNKNKNCIKKGRDKPTKHKIQLKNGSVVHCLPTGLSGYGIRGYTIDLLIADEAAFIPEEVWTAVSPMMATRYAGGARTVLLSTPHGREGYFCRCFSDETYTSFHVSSEDCPRISKEYLKHEKETMTKVQYAQEYLGEFIDELKQFFPDKLIRECMVEKRSNPVNRISGNYYLGVDVARMGEDESTFITLELNGDRFKQADIEVTRKTLTTETTMHIIQLDTKWNYQKIFIDDGGMGVGVFDQLLGTEGVRRKVVGINNARRSVERAKWKKQPRRKQLLKEDLYNNLLNLMEKGKITLINDNEEFLSLKSIQYEYTSEGNLRIYGKYSHITEGLIRAAWGIKSKGLNIYIY